MSIGPDGTLLPARFTGLCLTALPLVMCVPAAAAAAQEPVPATEASQPTVEPVIEFSADEVVYENQSDLITAQGRVRMSREGNYLAADKVSWDRRTGRVLAEGNVVIMTPEGDKLVSDRVDLTDSLRDGAVENLLIVLEGGGRMPEGPELENHCYPGNPRPGQRPDQVQRRPPHRPRRSPTAASDLQHRRRVRRRRVQRRACSRHPR